MPDWKLKTRGTLPIGLDIGHSSVRMLQLAATEGRLSAVAARSVAIEPDALDDEQRRRKVIISAVQRALAEGKFRRRDVVSFLPSDELRITSLRLDAEEAAELDQTLRQEAAQRFGLDPARDCIRYIPAGDVHHGDELKNEFILFAAAEQSVNEHIAFLQEMGLRPVGLDALPCALFRCFERLLQRQEDQERAVVFIDLGSRFTTVVFGRGRRITFVKQIAIGGHNFNKEISAKLGVSISQAQSLRARLNAERNIAESSTGVTGGCDSENISQPVEQAAAQALDSSTRQVIIDAIESVAEKLAREISLCFRYYTVTFRGKHVERAVFSGGEAYERILLNVLRRRLAVEAELAQPMRGFDMTNLDFDSDKRAVLCEWAVAVGLSLKGRKQITGGRSWLRAIPECVMRS